MIVFKFDKKGVRVTSTHLTASHGIATYAQILENHIVWRAVAPSTISHTEKPFARRLAFWDCVVEKMVVMINARLPRTVPL